MALAAAEALPKAVALARPVPFWTSDELAAAVAFPSAVALASPVPFCAKLEALAAPEALPKAVALASPVPFWARDELARADAAQLYKDVEVQQVMAHAKEFVDMAKQSHKVIGVTVSRHRKGPRFLGGSP